MAKYIEFVRSGTIEGRDTWYILNKRSHTWLGQISWYAPWKRFVADFNDESIWSADCLRDVADFIDRKEVEHE